MTLYHQNSQGYHYVFGVSHSSGGTSDFVGRRCVLEIQDGSKILPVVHYFRIKLFTVGCEEVLEE